MWNNNLIKILKTFSRKEMTRFWEFSNSPYFNKHGGVRGLVTYLNEIFPEFTEKKCNRTSILKNLSFLKKKEQKELALLFTYTMKLMEKFLTVEQFQKDESVDLFLLKSLRSKSLNLYYEKKLLAFQQKNKHKEQRDRSYFNFQYRLDAETDLYYGQASRMDQHRHIEKKQHHLDCFFLTEKLMDACEMSFRGKILKANYTINLLKPAIEELERNPNLYQNIPPVLVYYQIYKMLTGNDLGEYEAVLDILNENEKWLSKEELQNIYNYLQNYCIEQINKGKQDFLKELFHIYRSQLERELLFVNSYLPEFHFKNIVTTGLRLAENEWVRAFLDNYKKHLAPSVIENAYSYNLAAWYYNTQQHEKVLDLLGKVEYTNIRYNLDAKALLLKTYYDLEEEELLLSLTDAFQQFLKRNSLISEFQKKGYFNLLKFARRAFQIKRNIEFQKAAKWQEDLLNLKSEIEAAETIFNQVWLEEKIADLKF